jgi:hypothetical protein
VIAVSDCPDNSTLDLWLGGAGTPEGRAELEAHLDGCEECRSVVSLVAQTRAEPGAVREGDLLASKFRVDRILGQGGMGCVVEALHVELNQRYALKLMLPQAMRDPKAADRFLREARAAAQLKSEHVGRVVDFGRLPDGTPFMVMEYLEGETVEARLCRGPLGCAEAIDILGQSLTALAEAHQAGIVHRDFKPANLFLVARPDGKHFVKVLDFGIAKSINPVTELGLSTTGSAAVIGSPVYMAPEQLSAFSETDARCDVWAAGCVLYQMLTGAPPFMGNSATALGEAIQRGAHAPVLGVPRAVGALINRCLEKSPAARPADAAQLLHELSLAWNPKRAHRGWAWVSIAAVVVAAGAGIAWFSREVPAQEVRSGLDSGAAEPAAPKARPEIHEQPTPAAESNPAPRAIEAQPAFEKAVESEPARAPDSLTRAKTKHSAIRAKTRPRTEATGASTPPPAAPAAGPDEKLMDQWH